MSKNDPICLRCGQCCYLIVDKKPTDIKCKHLVKSPNGKTLCRIYTHRLYTKLGHGNICGPRSGTDFDYEGCPYNTNKPLVKNRRLENGNKERSEISKSTNN